MIHVLIPLANHTTPDDWGPNPHSLALRVESNKKKGLLGLTLLIH
jgi:hypothetical protein